MIGNFIVKDKSNFVKSHNKASLTAGLVNFIIYASVGIFAIICIIPFIYVLTYSFTPYEDYLKNPMSLIPRNINFSAYLAVINFPLIRTGYKNTLFITGVGTIINLILLVVSAYPLSKKDLKGRNTIMSLILFTMFFNGGLIPNYFLVRGLGILNTVWSLILPGAISAYNLILMKNFIADVPSSLEESAVIDGANEITVLIRIILPLCTPALATFALFYSVGHWNNFFSAVIYITKRSMWPLMLVLREMVVEDAVLEMSQGSLIDMKAASIMPFTLKMATIVVSMLPIICIYPFLQKFFMKGLLLGSIKG